MFDEIIDDVPAVETFTLEDMQNNYDAGVDSVIGKYDKAKGEWKTVEGYDGDEYYECSNCGEPWVLYAGTPKENNMNFCPNCGAKMSTEAEDAVPQSKKEVKAIETEHSCVTCKFGNLYSDSEPCCNCTDDNDMFEPIESEAENEHKFTRKGY